MIEKTVKDFIKRHNLSGVFLVGFSGGYDSMCLLHILSKFYPDIVAIHLNHNWRGKESALEAQNCEKFTKSLGIKFYSEILPETVEKTETSAREARYDFFRRCAEKFNSKVVFTAHNFDDNAETVLYRIIKGTGINGLQGIAEKREIFYRPLLKISRETIENYCKNNNLTPNIDSSNFNIKYKRNFIRHKIIPLMKEINPNVINAVNSLSDIAKNGEETDFIRTLLCSNNIEYDRKKIQRIHNFIEENKNSKSGKIYSLTNDLWLFVNHKNIEIISKSEKSLREINITQEGEYQFDDYIFSIKPFDKEIKTFPKDSDFKAYISTNKIDFTLRYRKDGDIIKPLGASGSQKLKKYLNEKKIPQHKKDKLVLLCQNSEVLWVGGIGLSDKIKVIQNPTHLISLRKVDYGH